MNPTMKLLTIRRVQGFRFASALSDWRRGFLCAKESLDELLFSVGCHENIFTPVANYSEAIRCFRGALLLQ